jgi:hypothetical protein
MANGVRINPSAMLSSNPGMLNNSSSSKNDFLEAAAMDKDKDEDEEEHEDFTQENVSAASVAAHCISLMEDEDLRRGKAHAASGKFKEADSPLRAKAATSYALAAMSGQGQVPSHIRDFLFGCLSSQTHLPFLSRTPL